MIEAFDRLIHSLALLDIQYRVVSYEDGSTIVLLKTIGRLIRMSVPW